MRSKKWPGKRPQEMAAPMGKKTNNPCDDVFFLVTRMPCGVMPSIAWFSPFKGFKCQKMGRNENESRIIGFCASVFEFRLDPTWKFECEMPCMALLLATKHPP